MIMSDSSISEDDLDSEFDQTGMQTKDFNFFSIFLLNIFVVKLLKGGNGESGVLGLSGICSETSSSRYDHF